MLEPPGRLTFLPLIEFREVETKPGFFASLRTTLKGDFAIFQFLFSIFCS